MITQLFSTCFTSSGSATGPKSCQTTQELHGQVVEAGMQLLASSTHRLSAHMPCAQERTCKLSRIVATSIAGSAIPWVDIIHQHVRPVLPEQQQTAVGQCRMSAPLGHKQVHHLGGRSSRLPTNRLCFGPGMCLKRNLVIRLHPYRYACSTGSTSE